jgi:hypothetical protein
LTLFNGVNIQYDGIKAVKIDVPDSMSGGICGICGNKDGVLNGDDLKLGYNVNGAWCQSLQSSGGFLTEVGVILDT